MYVSSITQEVSLRGRGSTSITLHCTLLYRSTTQSVIHTNQRFKLHAALSTSGIKTLIKH